MKKILSLLVCLIFCFGIFACGGDVDDVEEQGVPLNGKKLTISVDNKGYGAEWINVMAKAYKREVGTVVKVEPSSTLNELVGTQLSSGEKTSDIYFTFASETQWLEWTANDIIEPLDDVVEDARFRTEQVAQLGVYGEHKYYIPLMYSPTGIVYNTDYLTKLGYEKFPETWTGLIALCEECINSDLISTYTGVKVMPMSWGATVGDLIYMFRSLWAQCDPEGYVAYWSQDDLDGINDEKNKSLLVNDKTALVFDKIRDLLNPKSGASGYYPAYSVNNATAMNNIDAETSFLQGDSLFTITGSWFESEMPEQIESYDETKYGFACFPKIDETLSAVTDINLPGESFFISKNGKNDDIEESKNFLKYIFKEENLIKIQNILQVPLTVELDETKLNLTDWGKACLKVADETKGAIAFSNTKVFKSGAISLSLNAYWPKIATNVNGYVNANDMLNTLYNDQKNGWNNAISKVR